MAPKGGDRLFGGREGFTLIEVILAFSLFGILATTAFPQFFSGYESADRSTEQGVVGNVQTGVYLYGNESMTNGRSPTYPPVLDEADLGPAFPSNPIFVRVLSSPVAQDWVKEGVFTYRGPTGQLYVYDPDRGVLSPTDLMEVQGGPGPSRFGSVLDTFGNIVFYSSGAIVDQETSLAYFPDYYSGTVELTLVSGAVVRTNGDGSATVTLPDGQEIFIPDVQGEMAYYTIPPTEEGGSPTYVAVGRGQASESQSSSQVLERTSSYDRSSRTYNYATTYEMDGRYAGGSLSTEQGFLYETAWRSDQPSTVESSYTPQRDGSYTGTTTQSWQYSADSVYAYNREQGEERHAYGITSSTEGTARNEYSYDRQTGVYENRYSGTQSYEANHSTMDGDDRPASDRFDYEGSYRQNRRSGDYEGSARYRHRDGRDYTYEYSYNRGRRTYTSTYRDNRTGEERRHESRQ